MNGVCAPDGPGPGPLQGGPGPSGVTGHVVTGRDLVRLRLDFAYDGTAFHGWATQPGLRCVESELSAGLALILRAQPGRLTTAGRTDAGVHARGAVAHIDVPVQAWAALPGRSGRSPGEAAVHRLGGVLPADLVVRRVEVAPPGFDARFAATFRRYSYRVCDRSELLDPLRRHDTATHRRPLHEIRINQACEQLLGLRDFAAFCRPREGASTIRTLQEFRWERGSDDGVLTATVVADAFCHSMVRFLTGAAVAVGDGRREPDWPLAVLESGRRDTAVELMPARGLCLEEVGYPPPGEMATRAAVSRARRDGQEEPNQPPESELRSNGTASE